MTAFFKKKRPSDKLQGPCWNHVQ